MNFIKSKGDKCKIFLFLVPALVVYIVFLVIPLFGAFYFSTVTWNGIAGSTLKFVGMANFRQIFKDKAFIISLQNMGKMVFFSVLFHTPIALLLAVAIHAKIKAGRFFKVAFFVPTVFPLTSIGLLWYFIFMPNGSFNALLKGLGIIEKNIGWLIQGSTAMNTIIFVNIWAGIGYYMVILVAGLTTIPSDVYEAAAIDGATGVKKFFHITIPLLKPILAMCITMDIIGSIKVFDLIFIMTGGGPNGLTNLPTTLMYYESFNYDNYGKGSAIGVVIFAFALIFTLTSETLLNKKES